MCEADITVGGAVVCLTGVGCIVGAPAAAGGAAMVGAGAFGTADGIGRINDGLAKAFNEARNETSSSSNGGMGGLGKVKKPDPSADALAQRLGGASRVKFGNDPAGREFGAVSDTYVAQAKT
ncbi:restriction endonuclease fold toxin [Streptomyces minutiscleroticus]|uniref:restriction endonuclease fold toxin n=1 Tax=Streptomyces minutiscleroticus TaxID=68238 RepID=UPI00332EC310